MSDTQPKPIPGTAVILVIVGFALFLSAAFRIWIEYGRKDKAVVLEEYGQVPDFELKNQDGKTFTLNNLKGKVWAASFVFTTCKDICPMLTSTMKRLQQAMPQDPGFHMVSISVDPEKDTPEILLAYAQRVGADTHRWTFLTGRKAAIEALSIQGFKLGARPGERIGEGDDYEILHSNKIVLVDKQGEIRGYFDGTLSDQYPLLKKAAETLLKDQ